MSTPAINSKREPAVAGGFVTFKLLNAKQAAESLNISLRQIYDEVKEGRLPVVRIGTRVLFTPDDLAAYISTQRIQAVQKQ